MFPFLASPFALDALDTDTCFGGAVMFLRGRPLGFLKGGGLISGEKAVDSSKVGFARDVENRSSGLDCGT